MYCLSHYMTWDSGYCHELARETSDCTPGVLLLCYIAAIDDCEAYQLFKESCRKPYAYCGRQPDCVQDPGPGQACLDRLTGSA